MLRCFYPHPPERGQLSDAEVRLRTEVSPGATVSDSGPLNGPETYQMLVPSFAETPFRFMGRVINLGTLSERTLDLGMHATLDLGMQEGLADEIILLRLQ